MSSASSRIDVNSVSTGNNGDEDAWTMMWRDPRWCELLQAALRSASALGSVIIAASSMDDFSFLTEANFNCVYVAYPNSFEASINQMTENSCKAFEQAHANMQLIQNASSQIPHQIKLAVEIVSRGISEEAQKSLSSLVQGILGPAKASIVAAQACEKTFEDVVGLAREVVLGCTQKVGMDQEKIAIAQTQLKALGMQREQDIISLKQAEDTQTHIKVHLANAENELREAATKVPVGLEFVAVVGSIISMASHAATNHAQSVVKQTRASLAASQETLDEVSKRLVEVEHSIGKTTDEITSLRSMDATLKDLLSLLLTKLIPAYSAQREQFSQLTALLQEVMLPSIERLASTMDECTKLGGVSLTDFARRMINTQATFPVKAGILAERIASTYLTVSANHVLPAQRILVQMMEFAPGESPKAKAESQDKLQKSQAELQTLTDAASDQISTLVSAEQKGLSTAFAAGVATLSSTHTPTAYSPSNPVRDNTTQPICAPVIEFDPDDFF